MKLHWENRIAEFFKRQRGDATHEEFARRIGMSRSQYHRIEQGLQAIKVGQLELALRRLGIAFCDVVPAACPHRNGNNDEGQQP